MTLTLFSWPPSPILGAHDYSNPKKRCKLIPLLFLHLFTVRARPPVGSWGRWLDVLTRAWALQSEKPGFKCWIFPLFSCMTFHKLLDQTKLQFSKEHPGKWHLLSTWLYWWNKIMYVRCLAHSRSSAEGKRHLAFPPLLASPQKGEGERVRKKPQLYMVSAHESFSRPSGPSVAGETS